MYGPMRSNMWVYITHFLNTLGKENAMECVDIVAHSTACWWQSLKKKLI